SANNTFTKDFTIGITDVNESPTNITLTNSAVAENAGANATLGTLGAADPDAGETFTFALVAGALDNGQFNILGTTLRANASFDFEGAAGTTRQVRVQVTDSANNTLVKDFNINITNVNESPTDITLAGNSVAENAGVNA